MRTWPRPSRSRRRRGSPGSSQAFLDVCPIASFVDVSDAGHMVAGDRNDVFTDAVVEFLVG
jgi:pimeloyl-ACP methyl ester carboxylesterase